LAVNSYSIFNNDVETLPYTLYTSTKPYVVTPETYGHGTRFSPFRDDLTM
jgi:hypothetical protein